MFSHGWPLSADAWEDQMLFLASRGYRCIAHDRRGHGRSNQPWDGNDMGSYADDLAELVEQLDLRDAIHVGHCTGGGEVVRHIGRGCATGFWLSDQVAGRCHDASSALMFLALPLAP